MVATKTGLEELFLHIATLIPPACGDDCTLVGIDGRDGSGKTIFASNLAKWYRHHSDRQVINISIDDFHHPKSIRYRRGARSPEGYWLDSFDYERFRADVLTPLGAGGSRSYRKRSHDLTSDAVLEDEPYHIAPAGSVVIVDGVFLHRDELVNAWDVSVFLDVSADVCAERMFVRDGLVTELVPTARYHGGQIIYLRACNPKERATILVDNTHPEAPRLLHRGKQRISPKPDELAPKEDVTYCEDESEP